MNAEIFTISFYRIQFFLLSPGERIFGNIIILEITGRFIVRPEICQIQFFTGKSIQFKHDIFYIIFFQGFVLHIPRTFRQLFAQTLKGPVKFSGRLNKCRAPGKNVQSIPDLLKIILDLVSFVFPQGGQMIVRVVDARLFCYLISLPVGGYDGNDTYSQRCK